MVDILILLMMKVALRRKLNMKNRNEFAEINAFEDFEAAKRHKSLFAKLENQKKMNRDFVPLYCSPLY